MGQGVQPVRLGIIGCGRATIVHHVPAILRLPRIRVVAVADLDESRRDRAAGLLGIAERHASAEALLARGDLDAVAVVTPTATHADLGVAVLASGRHLFIEKPLALDPGACERLEAAKAAAAGCALVGHNARWHRLIAEARTMIREGKLGAIKAVLSVYTHWHPDPSSQPWHRHRAEGGGVLFNDSVHHVDLWRHLLGAEVAEVYARTRSTGTYDDDTSVIDARLTGGVLASLVLSFTTAPASTIEVFGEAGRLSVSLYRFDGLRFMPHSSYDGSLGWRARTVAQTLAGVPRMVVTAARGGEFTRTYEAMWRHFADCAAGRAVPACTLADGRAAVEVTRAAVESIDTRRPVALRPESSS